MFVNTKMDDATKINCACLMAKADEHVHALTIALDHALNRDINRSGKN